MKSGYDKYDGIWGNEYYDDQFGEISDRAFTQKTFVPSAALVSIGAVSPEELPEHNKARFYEDGTAQVPYEGQPYDPAKFRLVSVKWEHEHCAVCCFDIMEHHTFWQNSRGQILCDACHGHYVLRKL